MVPSSLDTDFRLFSFYGITTCFEAFELALNDFLVILTCSNCRFLFEFESEEFLRAMFIMVFRIFSSSSLDAWVRSTLDMVSVTSSMIAAASSASY